MAGSAQNRLVKVQTALQKGADIESRDWDGYTPLLNACYRGHRSVAILLLKSGAALDARDPNRQTCLIIAARADHTGLSG